MIVAVLVMAATSAKASLNDSIGAGFQMVGDSPSVTLKMRGLSVTPLELQYSYILGHGQEADINLYVLHTKYFKMHLIDPGIFLGKTLSGVDIGQNYDISFGGGVEITIWKRLVIFGSVRVYLPDPGAASKLIDSQTKSAGENSSAQTNNPNQIYDNAKGVAYNSVNDIYGAALRNYKMSFGVMWFFW